jgi:hypothetical protein
VETCRIPCYCEHHFFRLNRGTLPFWNHVVRLEPDEFVVCMQGKSRLIKCDDVRSQSRPRRSRTRKRPGE